MAWLKHKKEEPPEIGIGDHDFSQFVQDARRTVSFQPPEAQAAKR